MLKCRWLIILACLPAFQSSKGENFDLSLGAFGGRGTLDDRSPMLEASGFRLIASAYRWKTGLLTISPQIGYEMSSASYRSPQEDTEADTLDQVMDYRHNTALLGVMFEWPVWGLSKPNPNLAFVRVMGGLMASGVHVNRSNLSEIRNAELTGVRGQSLLAEAGTIFPLQRDFAVTLASVLNLQSIDLSRTQGTEISEFEPHRGLPLTTRNVEGAPDNINAQPFYQTIGVAIGLRLLL